MDNIWMVTVFKLNFFLKIENEDGVTAVGATDDVAPINMIGATIWKNIKVSFRSAEYTNLTLEFLFDY